MKTHIKSGDLDSIRKALLWRKDALRDKFFLGELFFKSGFDRSTVKFYLSVSENEIEFIDEVIKAHKSRGDFLALLEALSAELISESESDSEAISSVIGKYSIETEGEAEGKTKVKKDENPALQMTAHIHGSIKSFFALGIQIKKYDGMTLEAFKTLNERMRQYCVKQGKGSLNESDAINTIFSLPEGEHNPFRIPATETGQNQKIGLQELLNGLVSFYRKPVAHSANYIQEERQFIEAMFLISSLLFRFDEGEL